MPKEEVSRQIAVEQVLRFENYPGFPGEDRPADQDELIRAFRRAACSNAEAIRIGDYFIEKLKYCPKPADVYELAEQFSESRRYEWDPTPYGAPGSTQGSLVDDLTEADIERWRNMAEHGSRKAAREIAKAVLKRHEEFQRSRQGIAAEAKA